MTQTAPWFVWIIMEVVGVLLLASGIPLARRRVPPNIYYGARFEATLSSEAVWYEVNARCGRHFIAIGVAYLILLNGLLLARQVSETTTITIALVFCVGALLADAVFLYRAATRLSVRERAQSSNRSREP